METLRSEQIQEFKERRAIRWRPMDVLCFFYLPLVGALIMTILGGFVGKVLFDWAVFGHKPSAPPRWDIVTLVFGTLSVSFIAVNFWIHRAELHAYWRRNVVGYVARFVFFDIAKDGKSRQLQYTIRTRREDADDRRQTHRTRVAGEHDIAISLPLGGWFARGWFRGMDRDQIERFQGWSVRLRAILDTGAVMVEVRCQNRQWGINERVVTDIGSVLEYLEEIATMTAGNASMSVSDFLNRKVIQLEYAERRRVEEHQQHAQRMDALFRAIDAATGHAAPPTGGDLADWVVEQVRRLVSERDAAKKELDDSLDLLHKLFLILRQILGETSADPEWKDHVVESAQDLNIEYKAAREDRNAARTERDEAANFIVQLAKMFEMSTRLHDKLQALRIWERVCVWLYDHRFPITWETSDPNVQWQHDADAAALAKVRAFIKVHERRDRRRHGRKTTAVAPA